MQGKILFVLGAAAGYVVGTRTGRQGYERLKRQASALWKNPKVQSSVTSAEDFARDRIPVVGPTVSSVAKKAGDAVTEAVEKNEKSSPGTGSTPAPGSDSGSSGSAGTDGQDSPTNG